MEIATHCLYGSKNLSISEDATINYGWLIDKSKVERHGRSDKFDILQELKIIWVNFSQSLKFYLSKSVERTLNNPINRLIQLKSKLLNYPNLKTNN